VNNMGVYKLWSRGLPFIILDKDTDIIFMTDELTFEEKSDKDAIKVAEKLVIRGGEDMSCTLFKKTKSTTWSTLLAVIDFNKATGGEE